MKVVPEADRKLYVLRRYQHEGKTPGLKGKHYATYQGVPSIMPKEDLERYFEFGTLNTKSTTSGRDVLYLKFKDGVVEQPIASEVNIPRWSPSAEKPLGTYGLENYQKMVNLDGNGYFEYAAPSGFLKYLLVDEHLDDNDSTVDVNMGPGLDEYATF